MAQSPANTAFVLVPGGYCLASLYRSVTDKLTSLGYTAIESDNPTITHPDKEHKVFMDDAEQVRSVASNLMDKGKDVVVVGNSYGGFVITEAVKGLSKAEREAAGKSGGQLLNLVYFGSLFAPAGITCKDFVSKYVGVFPDTEGPLLDPPPPEIGGGMIFSDLSKEDQIRYGEQFQTQAKAAFDEGLTYEGYLHVPVTYIVTERDASIPAQAQHQSVDEVLASGKGEIRKKTINSDHCPMVSHPEELVKLLLEAADVSKQ